MTIKVSLEEWDVERGSTGWSSLKGLKKKGPSSTRPTFELRGKTRGWEVGDLWEIGWGHKWTILSAVDTTLNWTVRMLRLVRPISCHCRRRSSVSVAYLLLGFHCLLDSGLLTYQLWRTDCGFDVCVATADEKSLLLNTFRLWARCVQSRIVSGFLPACRYMHAWQIMGSGGGWCSCRALAGLRCSYVRGVRSWKILIVEHADVLVQMCHVSRAGYMW